MLPAKGMQCDPALKSKNDISADSGNSPASLLWPRFSTVRLDRARQAFAGMVPASTGPGGQPLRSVLGRSPPQP